MNKAAETLAHLSNPTLKFYLNLMADTETPPIMHAWSLIAAASACMTRRRYFKVGALTYWPNQYILLTGPAGVRKSTAIAFARKLVADIEGFRFGPNNTGGRLQGLVAYMIGGRRKEEAEDDKAAAESLDAVMASINLTDLGEEIETEENRLNKSALWVAESEAVTFLGRQMDEFITFMGDIWDCPDKYDYSLKRERMEVHYPCVNFIGGITPMHITTYLPVQSIGQGFSSRVLFVYAGVEDNKTVPWPEPINEDGVKQIKHIMQAIYATEPGPFNYTSETKQAIIDLYAYKVAIEDVRFAHYSQRRQAHLLKTAMALAALRLDDTVTAADVHDAHALLVLTEARMTDALGTHGLTEAALAKARLKDFMQGQNQPVSMHRIALGCGSDVKKGDVQRALSEFLEAGQILQVVLQDDKGAKRIGFVWVSDTNVFRRDQVVPVKYSLDETTAVLAGASVRDEAAQKAAAMLATEEQEMHNERLIPQAQPETTTAENGANIIRARLDAIKARSKQL